LECGKDDECRFYLFVKVQSIFGFKSQDLTFFCVRFAFCESWRLLKGNEGIGMRNQDVAMQGRIRMRNGDVPMQWRMRNWDEESGFANAKEDDQMHCARAGVEREREIERERDGGRTSEGGHEERRKEAARRCTENECVLEAFAIEAEFFQDVWQRLVVKTVTEYKQGALLVVLHFSAAQLIKLLGTGLWLLIFRRKVGSRVGKR
jgi:hypothetical protein